MARCAIRRVVRLPKTFFVRWAITWVGLPMRLCEVGNRIRWVMSRCGQCADILQGWQNKLSIYHLIEMNLPASSLLKLPESPLLRWRRKKGHSLQVDLLSLDSLDLFSFNFDPLSLIFGGFYPNVLIGIKLNLKDRRGKSAKNYPPLFPPFFTHLQLTFS